MVEKYVVIRTFRQHSHHREDFMMSALEAPLAVHRTADALTAQILEQLNEEAVIGLNALIQMLPDYSWNQIFAAVDRLARTGQLVLRRHGYDYTLFSMAYPT
jgi:hypothetical protein